MTRVKLCGITSADDRDAAIHAGADAIGVLVDIHGGSPREVSAVQAQRLLEDIPPFLTSVLVTMAESIDRITKLHRTIGADVVQLHGNHSRSVVADVSATVDRPVIVAVTPETPNIEAVATVADALLVDTPSEAGGGTGRTHDWKRSRTIVDSLACPVILAGGLHPDNVADAVRTVSPYGVDVASGVERQPGQKDHDAMAAFVHRAKRAEVPAR